MATSTARTPQSGEKKGRPVAGRPLKNFINTDNLGDSTHSLRLQFLMSRIGIGCGRAALLSDLAWEVSNA